jgi:hypothetical protein
MTPLARKLLGVATMLIGVAGCAAIVGIEDRTFDGGPTDGGTSNSPACNDYCSKVMTACPGHFAVYSSADACLGVCRRLPPGDEVEPAPNTLACRRKQVEFAITTQEPRDYCPAAGPGGAGTCGTNCESWCTLLQQTCPKEYSAMPDCPRACSALKDTGKFDADLDHDGDTIQCRLVHVSNANSNASAPATHCGHAALVSSEYCEAPQDKAPDCAEFCRFNAAGCPGDLSVYESNQQCLAVCGALPPGTNGDREENTMGCRSWHTFNALIDPASHCGHTGPGGDGHCGVDAPDKTGNCVAYCILAEKACATGFAAKYSSQSACQVDCSNQPDAFGAKHDSKYRLATSATGNTLQCRLLHVSRALSDATECPSGLGQGVCQ